ncbi:MAG: thioesterase [Gammaproteobacteria bacterium]|nr:MAG: thioesterase [Gammaproteobacteria bacterium]
MFSTTLPIYIEHINYGHHLAHDKLITLMHEARLQFFDRLGQSEMDFYGISLIMKSLTVNYRQEAFRGDKLTFALTIREVRGSAFMLHYDIRNQHNEAIADAQIVLVGYDYGKRRVARLPDLCRQALTSQGNDA